MILRRPVLRSVAAVLTLALVSLPAMSQQRVESGSGAMLRALDKITGETTDLEIPVGKSVAYGRLRILLADCRYPPGSPNSDAFALLDIRDIGRSEPAFAGWMVASSPALNALDHPRYDVWVLRCTRA